MPWRFNPFTGNLDETGVPAFNGEVTLGSAASPSIFFTGDTNTGIYSPGADQVAISTNGTGRLFVDSSGRVGVGTGPDGISVLAIKQITDATNGGLVIYATDGTGAVISRLTDGGLTFRNGGSERLRITSDGKVGVGTTSPDYGLDVVLGIGIQEGQALNWHNGSGSNSAQIYGDGSDNLIFRNTSSNTERARIDSSGRLLVGTTSDSGGALLQVNGDRVRIATAKTPASASDTGTTGEVCWDADYIYVCTATNTWKRSALSTW